MKPYNTLTDKQKETLREAWRKNEYSSSDNYWSEGVIEDWLSIFALLGIETTKRHLYWSGFSSQGDGASFEGRYTYGKNSYRAIKAYAPTNTKLHQLAYDLWALQKKHWFKLEAKIVQGRDSNFYSHSGTMGFAYVYGVHDRDLSGNAEPNDTLMDLLRRAADMFYYELEDAYDFHMSDENIDYDFENNGYEWCAGELGEDEE